MVEKYTRKSHFFYYVFFYKKTYIHFYYVFFFSFPFTSPFLHVKQITKIRNNSNTIISKYTQHLEITKRKKKEVLGSSAAQPWCRLNSVGTVLGHEKQLGRRPLDPKPHGLLFAPASAVTSTASQGMRYGCLKVRPSLSFQSSPPVEIYLHLKQKKKANPNSSWFN